MEPLGFMYYKRRLPAFISICAGANSRRVYQTLHHGCYFPEQAILYYEDEEAVKIILKHDREPQTEEYKSYYSDSRVDIPHFFFAKTKKMVQLCIDNGVNVHEVSRYNKKNVLWSLDLVFFLFGSMGSMLCTGNVVSKITDAKIRLHIKVECMLFIRSFLFPKFIVSL